MGEYMDSNRYEDEVFGSQFGSTPSTFPYEMRDGSVQTQVHINADTFMYRNLLHRSIHWIYLIYIIILYFRYHLKKWFKKLHDEIKDDKYLIDMELNNVP